MGAAEIAGGAGGRAGRRVGAGAACGDTGGDLLTRARGAGGERGTLGGIGDSDRGEIERRRGATRCDGQHGSGETEAMRVA